MKNSAKLLRCGLWGIIAVCLFASLPGYTQAIKRVTPTPANSNTSVVKSPTPTPKVSVVPTIPAVTKSGEPTAAPQNTTTPPAGDNTTAGTGTQDSEKIKSLYLETLYQDIDTANYYELVDWCQRLSLSDAGDVNALKSRLYAFFNLQPVKSTTPAPTQTPAPSGQPASTNEAKVQDANAGKLIQIRSAKSTEYFKIEEINEEYLILQGDVVIEFQDSKEGSTHIISAQRVMVNQTQKLLTAVGDIKYSLVKPGEAPEVFTGESFVFNIDSWAGGFVDARGEKKSEVADNKEVKFLYQGESLSRLKNDIIILQKGMITSCENTDDPHWGIKAQKIWVLAPGEWAVRDAILHVGRVPVFYLPFFFKPGDDFFFHPVIGYRAREGFFIQTTTYLLGQKKEKDSAFSFLRASEDKQKEYELELNGLFLKKGQKKDKKSEDARLLKIIADFYTRLGGFAGVVLDLGSAWQLKGGLGFSRNVYLNDNAYSPYEDNALNSKWNTTPLWGINLPFRFGFDTNFRFNLLNSAVGMNGTFQLFSDPFFEEDFYDRSEDIDWLKLIKNDNSTETTQTNQTSTPAGYDLVPNSVQKNTITWSLNSAINLPTISPYLNVFKINSLNLGWTWYSKPNEDSLSTTVHPIPLLNAVDPARQFYYPLKWRFPENVNLQVQGTLLDWNSQRAPVPSRSQTGEPTDIKTGNDFGKGFSFPETNPQDDSVQTAASVQAVNTPTVGVSNAPNTENKTKETASEDPFLEPDALDDLPVEFGRPLGSSFNIVYSLNPYLTLENQFDTDDWKRPQDVNFATKYLELMHSGNYYLNYTYSLWGALIKGNGGFLLSERYQDRLYNTDPAWNEASDQQNSDLNINATTTVTLQPLLDLKYFSTSSLEYTLNSDLYKYAYDTGLKDFKPKFVDWNTTYIKNHRVKAVLNFTPDTVTHFLALSATLPPLYGDYGGTLNFTFQNQDYYSLNTNITTNYKQIPAALPVAEHWEFSPLVVTETLKLSTWLALTEVMTWNLNEQLFTEARTMFKSFWLPFWNKYLLEGELILHPNEEADPLYLFTSVLNIENFKTTFRAQQMQPKVLDINQGQWKIVSTDPADQEFLPQSLRFEYKYDIKDLRFWKNRITSNIYLDTYWELILQEFTNSQFKFTFKWDFELYEFLNFNITIASHNNRTYLYFPDWAKQTGESWVNPFFDLLKSFNFFYETDRYNSNFKLDYISIGLLHHLHDWDLKLDYIGRQNSVTGANGITAYKWQPEFTLSLEWNPIPELAHKVKQQADNLNWNG